MYIHNIRIIFKFIKISLHFPTNLYMYKAAVIKRLSQPHVQHSHKTPISITLITNDIIFFAMKIDAS